MNPSSIAEHSTTQDESFKSDNQLYSSTLSHHLTDNASLFDQDELSALDNKNNSFMSVSTDSWMDIATNPLVIGVGIVFSMLLLSVLLGLYKSRRMSIEKLAEAPEMAKMFWESSQKADDSNLFKDKDAFIKYCKDNKVSMPTNAEWELMKENVQKLGYLCEQAPANPPAADALKYPSAEQQKRMLEAFKTAFQSTSDVNGKHLAFTPEFFSSLPEVNKRTEDIKNTKDYTEKWMAAINKNSTEYVGAFMYYIVFASLWKTPVKRAAEFDKNLAETVKTVYTAAPAK
jgi:hypothetical protein